MAKSLSRNYFSSRLPLPVNYFITGSILVVAMMMVWMIAVSASNYMAAGITQIDNRIEVDGTPLSAEFELPRRHDLQRRTLFISNTSDVTQELVLLGRFRFIDHLHVVATNEAGDAKEVISAELLTPFAERPHQHRWLHGAFFVEPQQTVELFIEAQDLPYAYLPMHLFDRKSFDALDQAMLMNTSGVIYVLAFLAIIGFGIALISRNVLYLAYAFHQTILAIYLGQIHNIWFQYLWPNSAQFNNDFTAVLGLTVGLAALVLARTLFGHILSRRSWLRWWCDILIGVAVATQLAVIVSYSGIVHIIILVVPFLCIGSACMVAVRAQVKRVVYAKYYLIGCVFYVSGVNGWVASAIGMGSFDVLYSTAILEVAILLDATLFTMAIVSHEVSKSRSRALLQEAYNNSLRNNLATNAERDLASRLLIEKSRQLSSNAHDIRQPLYAIGLHARAIENEKVRKAITDSAKAIDRFTTGVLNVENAYMRSQHSERVLRKVFEELVDRYKPLAEDCEKRVVITSACDVIISSAQRTEIDRLFTNILLNAIQHGDEHFIHIEITKFGKDVLVEISNAAYRASVDDFDRQLLEHRRMPGTPSPEIAGTGIGVLTSYRLAEQLNIDLSYTVTDNVSVDAKLVLPSSMVRVVTKASAAL